VQPKIAVRRAARERRAEKTPGQGDPGVFISVRGKRASWARDRRKLVYKLHTAKADVLHLHEFLDAVLRAFAAEPGLLDAAERRDFGRDEPGVDANHPVFERFSDAPDAPEIARVEIGSEPELRAVGELDHFPVIRKSDQWRNRTERLLTEDL